MMNNFFSKVFNGRLLPVLASGVLLGTLAMQAVPSVVSAADLPPLTQLIKQNSAAVVHIEVEADNQRTTMRSDRFEMPGGQALPEEFRRFFRNMPDMPPRRSAAMGSGFIISEDGYIVTNAHVVDGADSATVRLNDKRELKAEVIGYDKYSDIALLKVAASGLPTVRLGDSEKLEVGQWVVAIGAPFGLDHTATQGIVSAKSRSLPDGTYVPFIQTDVAVNPGNSGGPLFDLNGNVVGVNSQIYSRSGGYMGISFAIPVNLVKNVTEQLKASGSVSRGWLGVHIQNLDQELADSFNMSQPKGALVASVQPDSPADNAGMQAGDIIVGFDRTAVESANHLPLLVGDTPVGKQVAVRVLRGGAERTLQVKIDRLQDESEPVQLSSRSSSGRLGLAVAPLTEAERKAGQLEDNGVAVRQVQPGSAAAKAGLQEGDIVLSINNVKVDDPAALKQQVEQAPADRPIAMLIQRDQTKRFIAVQPS